MKFPGWFMFWGTFSGTGEADLVLVSKQSGEAMNQYSYYELLNEYLPDVMDKCSADVFQQDGATSHTANSVTQWLKDCQVNYIDDWPGQSPDLNPIENLWQIVKSDLQGKDVSTYEKLEKEVRASWDRIPVETLHNLALSVPRRLQEVKKRKGGATKYYASVIICLCLSLTQK